MDSLAIVTPPPVEPVTLDEAKLHLRVTIADDDALITSLITAARMIVEARLRQTLITTVYDWTSDGFPSISGYWNRQVRQQGFNPSWFSQSADILAPPRPPIISVQSVTYVNTTGTPTVIDAGTYTVTTGPSGRIQPLLGSIWPVGRPQIGGVTIRYTAGYGSTAGSVPEPAKAAIKLLVGHLYEHRESVADVQTYPVPDTVDALLATMDHGSYA